MSLDEFLSRLASLKVSWTYVGEAIRTIDSETKKEICPICAVYNEMFPDERKRFVKFWNAAPLMRLDGFLASKIASVCDSHQYNTERQDLRKQIRRSCNLV